MFKKCLMVLFVLVLCNYHGIAFGFEKFIPAQGGDTEVWRITDDPTMRDWSNYHNADAWSPDGRYVCWEHWAYLTKPDYPTDRGKASQVFIFDFNTKKEKLIGTGSQPRWATNHNWLFFVQDGKDVIWYDVDNDKKIKLTTGVLHIGETDPDDKWLYGSTASLKKRGPKGTIVRIPLKPDSQPELLPEARGVFYLPNPRHPKVLFRVDGLLPKNKKKPLTPIHVMTDLEGNNESMLSPELRHCHQTWSGDGQWLLMGNGQMRGRKWNEPFPSNSHYLANISCGDISPSGKSGRWIVGGNNIGSMQVADLWSGDGRVYLRALSFVHAYGDWHANSVGDNDSKGSPDGTKVVFVTNYDLKNAPYTKIAKDMPSADANRIVVDSTEGFPKSGHLSIQAEIIGYKRKTKNSFEGLKREMYGVRAESPGTLSYFPPDLFKHYTEDRLHLKKGLIVTSFDARLIPEEMRKGMIMPNSKNLPDGWQDNPVTWQRRSDVHVAVVRKPDRPFLQAAPIGDREDVQLVPGQNHSEIKGYFIYKDGLVINDKLLKPGETLSLGSHASGRAHLYIQAVAVEWSGLQSEKSITLTVMGNPNLKVLEETPGNFKWTYEQFLIDGNQVAKARAIQQGSYVKETVHIYDGIISRQWYQENVITKQHDLNKAGQATRRLYYSNGKLAKREYWNQDDIRVSEEMFANDGYITESKTWAYDLYLNDMILAESYLESHWFYEKGLPVKLIGSDSYYNYTSFPGIYLLRDDNWIKVKELPCPKVKVK